MIHAALWIASLLFLIVVGLYVLLLLGAGLVKFLSMFVPATPEDADRTARIEQFEKRAREVHVARVDTEFQTRMERLSASSRAADAARASAGSQAVTPEASAEWEKLMAGRRALDEQVARVESERIAIEQRIAAYERQSRERAAAHDPDERCPCHGRRWADGPHI
jgi:hypothetical protein